MDTSNPLFFIIDMVKQFLMFLDSFNVAGVSFFTWIISFILFGMIVSIFWRGARG